MATSHIVATLKENAVDSAMADQLFDSGSWFLGWEEERTGIRNSRLRLYFEGIVSRAEIRRLIEAKFPESVKELAEISDWELAAKRQLAR